MPSEASKVSRSGAITTATGERHIPSSTRSDGSVRKEIRIRPGYRPPEDVDVYKSKTAQAWRDRGKGGVPGAIPGADTAESKSQGQSAAANKNAKRREARKKAAAATSSSDGVGGDKPESSLDGEVFSATATSTTSATAAAPTEQNAPKDPDAEKEKEAKKLAKKLRQARELKDKKDKGDALLPEQFEKVIRINELVRQLDNLGFDVNGEKKQQEDETT